jgi:hypothetical protein
MWKDAAISSLDSWKQHSEIKIHIYDHNFNEDVPPVRAAPVCVRYMNPSTTLRRDHVDSGRSSSAERRTPQGVRSPGLI